MKSLLSVLNAARATAGRSGRRVSGSLRRLFVPEPVRIAPFLGYGSRERIRLSGRILEEEGIVPAELADTRWKNFRNLLRRFNTDEIPGVRVAARHAEVEHQAVSDAEGYFHFDFAAEVSPEMAWHSVALQLPDLHGPSGEPVTAEGRVLVPPASARFGVISDLDDTVIQTDVTKRLRMLIKVALHNERTRSAFPGVAAFYRALHRGAGGDEQNPLFYVSSSPWNFFDLLLEFFRIQDIPHGPMFLKDYALSTFLFPGRHRTHKLGYIRSLLDFYPGLPFLLIGDSGEQDPEIYAETVRSYPGRIRGIYIRNVTSNLRRAEAIGVLAREVLQTGCPLVVTPDTVVAAEHAAGAGFISPDALPEVRAVKTIEQRQPLPAE